jgi:hypothetical protein
MTERQENTIRESFYNSPIFQYYNEKGHARAAAIANQIAFGQTKEGKKLAALGGIKAKLNGTKLKKTEISFSKEKILKAHSVCQTWNDVLAYLGIWHGTYTRLCKKYNIEELKADRAIRTKLSKQHNVIVYKLIFEKYKVYKGANQVAADLDLNKGSIMRLAKTFDKKDKGKINHTSCKNGDLFTFEYTGKLHKLGNRDASKEIIAYKIIEKFYKEYDSITDANDDLDISFFKQLQNKCHQTGGYRIYKK